MCSKELLSHPKNLLDPGPIAPGRSNSASSSSTTNTPVTPHTGLLTPGLEIKTCSRDMLPHTGDFGI